MFVEIGHIRQVTPDEVWGKRSGQFTPWLAENIHRLKQVLQVDLERDDTEPEPDETAMGFIARDRQYPVRKFLISCGLSPDSLPGMEEVFDQTAMHGVQTLVWISPTFSRVQLRVLDWLNAHMESMCFYAVGMELLQIGDSLPALEWKLYAGPEQSAQDVFEADTAIVQEEASVIAAKGAEEEAVLETPVMEKEMEEEAVLETPVMAEALASGEAVPTRLFEEVSRELQVNHSFFSDPLAPPHDKLVLPSGQSGVSYRGMVTEAGNICTRIEIGFWLARGNKWIFNALQKRRPDLEESFGEALVWEKLEGVGRITLYRRGSTPDLSQDNQDVRNWIVSRLVKLRAVFSDPVAQLALQSKPLFEPDPDIASAGTYPPTFQGPAISEQIDPSCPESSGTEKTGSLWMRSQDGWRQPSALHGSGASLAASDRIYFPSSGFDPYGLAPQD